MGIIQALALAGLAVLGLIVAGAIVYLIGRMFTAGALYSIRENPLSIHVRIQPEPTKESPNHGT